MLKAEATKVLIIILLLWLGFKMAAGNIVPLALMAGLAAAAILSGAALTAQNVKKQL